MKKIIFPIFCVIFFSGLFSQDIQEEWVNNQQYLMGIEILIDNFDNVYVLTYEFSILKYDNAGNLIWSTNYENRIRAIDFELDNANNVIVTGLKSGENSYSDMVTLSYNSEGELLWEQIYQTPD
jgi:hypothetical protein